MTDDRDDMHGSDGVLAPFLSAARAERPEPGADLMARVMSDARAEASRARTAAPRPATRQGVGAWLAAAVGGWGAAGGLVAAAAAGLWIGFAMPAPVAGIAAQILGADDRSDDGAETVDLLPDLEVFFLAEG